MFKRKSKQLTTSPKTGRRRKQRSRKRVFVAFCGGCKPEIDRKAVLQAVERLLPDYLFQYEMEPDDPVCCLLILNGCPTACRTKDFAQNPNCIFVRGEMIGNRMVKEELLPEEVVRLVERYAKGLRGIFRN